MFLLFIKWTKIIISSYVEYLFENLVVLDSIMMVEENEV